MSRAGIDQRWTRAQRDLLEAARAADVDVALLAKIAGFESGYNPDARPVSSNPAANRVRQFDGAMALSSAYGYGQFLDGTWREMIHTYGGKYGVADASNLTLRAANAAELRKNPPLQAAMLAEFTRENALKGSRLGGPNPDANVYAFHNLGDRDATRFLQALKTNPDQPVASVLSVNIIRGNPALYGNGDRSIGNAYLVMGQQMARFEGYAQQARLLTGDGSPVLERQSNAPLIHAPANGDEPGSREASHVTGSVAGDIRHIQQLLNKLGYHDARGRALQVDGDFGARTRQAVNAFQQAYGLPQVDHVGPKTRQALRDAEQAPSPVDPAHPDHALYRQTLGAVQRLDRELGRTPDAASERLAASLTRLAKENGLTRVDQVVLSIDNGQVKQGENVFVVQGRLEDPAQQRASMKTQLASDTPVAESFRQLDQANARQREQALQAAPAQHAPQAHAEYREGARLVPAR